MYVINFVMENLTDLERVVKWLLDLLLTWS
jgi:hypothetical protein